MNLDPWEDHTGLKWFDLDDKLGFIYELELSDGGYYYGRKQFWRRARNKWYETDWREYKSSSRNVLAVADLIQRSRIVATFSSKSALRYAEAMAIIVSGGYEDEAHGYNWSFAGCMSKLKLTEQDRFQLQHLFDYCYKRRQE